MSQFCERVPERKAFSLPKEGKRLERVVQKRRVEELIHEGFGRQSFHRSPRPKPVSLQLVKQAVHHPEYAKHQEIKGHVNEIFPGPATVFVKIDSERLSQSTHGDAHRKETKRKAAAYVPICEEIEKGPGR